MPKDSAVCFESSISSLGIITPSLFGTKTSLPSSPTITGSSFLTGPPTASCFKSFNCLLSFTLRLGLDKLYSS